MACNGYEVIDLGVMVPADQIVARAKEEHVDMIGLSGLITPSLEEMVNVASELKKAGLDIPIMIGGATTSQNPLVAQRLMADAEGYNEELNRTYAHLREQYIQEQQQLLSLDEARRRKTKLFE